MAKKIKFVTTESEMAATLNYRDRLPKGFGLVVMNKTWRSDMDSAAYGMASARVADAKWLARNGRLAEAADVLG